MSVSELKNNRDVLSLDFSASFDGQDTVTPEEAMQFTRVPEFQTLQQWHNAFQDQLGVGIVIRDGETRVKKNWAITIKLWIDHTRLGYVNPYKVNISPTQYPRHSLPPAIRKAVDDACNGPTRDVSTYYGVHAFLLSASLAAAQTFRLVDGESPALYMLSVGANKRALELLINKAMEWTTGRETSPITLYPLRPSKRCTELRKDYEGKKVSGFAHEFLSDVLSPKLDALKITAPEHFLLEQWRKGDPLALSIITDRKSLQDEVDDLRANYRKRPPANFHQDPNFDQCDHLLDRCLISTYRPPRDAYIGPSHPAPFVELFNNIAHDISVSGSHLGPLDVSTTKEQERAIDDFYAKVYRNISGFMTTPYAVTLQVRKLAVIFSAFYSHQRLIEKRTVDNESFERALAVTEWHLIERHSLDRSAH